MACYYPLSISETFDRALKTQLVPVLSGLLCIYAVGSIIGPYTASVAMQYWGNDALFGVFILLELSLVIFILYRMSVRQARPVEDQESFVMHSPSAITEELDPRVEYQEHSQPFELAYEELVSLLDKDNLDENSNEAVRYLRSVSLEEPDWVVPLISRISDFGFRWC